MIKAVLFDLDGTLLDTIDDFVLVINKALGAEDKVLINRQSIMPYISNGARTMVKFAFNIDEHSEVYEKHFNNVLSLYAKHLGECAQLFSGMAEILQYIDDQHIKWGIVTNKHRRFSEPLLAIMKLKPHTLVCADDVTNPKPAPEPVQLACKQLNCNPDHTIMIGDHERDIRSGNDAGSITVAANWGYVRDQESINWGADYILENPLELKTLIQKSNDNKS